MKMLQYFSRTSTFFAAIILIGLVSCSKEERGAVNCPRIAALKETQNDPLYKITVYAGKNLENGEDHDIDGVLCKARFSNLIYSCVHSDGTVFLSDTYNRKVKKISPEGVVSTLASLKEGMPLSLKCDLQGNLYVLAVNSAPSGVYYSICKINPAGQVVAIVENTGQGMLLEDISINNVGEIFVATRSQIFKYSDDGNKVLYAGKPTAGFMNGQKEEALFNSITGLECDKEGNLYVTDGNNFCVRKIAADGTVSTVAGKPGVSSHPSKDGTGEGALFSYPTTLALDEDGNIFVGEQFSIRKINREQKVSTISSNSIYNIKSLCANSRFLYLTEDGQAKICRMRIK